MKSVRRTVEGIGLELGFAAGVLLIALACMTAVARPPADAYTFSTEETEACQGLYGRSCSENTALQMPDTVARYKAVKAQKRGEAVDGLGKDVVSAVDDAVAAKAAADAKVGK